MRKFKRLMLIAVGAIATATALSVGAWIYVVTSVEQPRYSLVTQHGLIEIRDYPALVVAEVTRHGDRNSAVRAGFGPLAAYIFARNRGGDGIAMTAPVTQERQAIAMTAPVTQTAASKSPAELPNGSTADVWLIRFIMPSNYTLEALPKAAGDDVRLKEVGPSRRAAIRFSGVATDVLIAKNEEALRAWLSARDITITSTPTYAYYNDPFTPGPLRRNEVLFDVVMP